MQKYKNSVDLNPEIVLKAMIYTNIFMFVICLLFSIKELNFSANPLFFLAPSPNKLIFFGASGTYVINKYETFWSVISANWLHGSLLHLLFNMMALRTLVPLSIKEYGISRMFTIYSLAGAGGFLLSYVGNVYSTIGASSGICGLIGAILYFGKSRGGQWGRLVYKETTGWVISLVIIGFLIPSINNWGHAGGLFSGLFLGWLFGYNERRKENISDQIMALFLVVITAWLLARPVIEGVLLISS